MALLKWVLTIVAVVMLALIVINGVPFLRNLAGQGGVTPTGLSAKIPGSGAAAS